ncbi:hypothetical protein AAF712_004592 [Marasmius tenuissimus]|uniref:Uncharacterized protein n=1 Tax=Marasmius tenuissimus TaxID=585030 RepID=A0ABR3A2K8_9AGAR
MMAPVILVYPASNPSYEDDQHLSQGKLAHLVESYPTVILHLMSIWVRATELGLGPTIVAGALHAITLCLEALTGNEKAVGQSQQRLLQGEVLSGFKTAILDGKLNISRRELPTSCLCRPPTSEFSTNISSSPISLLLEINLKSLNKTYVLHMLYSNNIRMPAP